MDVLFNSINVRDLLSSHDLDDSSPLSAPDLRLLNRPSSSPITRHQVQSPQLHTLSQRRVFYLFSRCSDAVVNSEQLSDQVSNLVNLLSSDRKPIDVQVKETVDEIRSKCGELKEKKDALGLVEVVVKLSRELSVVEDDLVAGKVFEAAEVLTELKVALRVTEDCTEESEPVVFGLLRKKWTECFEEIQQVLVKFVEKAVKFDPQTNSVYVKNNMSMNDDIQGIELCTVLKAMHVVGILDYGLAKVADLMTRHVITPAVGSISHSFSVEEQRLDSGDITEAVLRITPLTGTQVENMDAENIYSGISVVIQFIFNYICFQNSSWMQLFGRLTWPHMSELIISNFLSKIVPDDASKLSDFQTIRQLTSEFETSLKEVMFISSEKDERLTNFTDNVEVHFATRKKVEILATARDLLLHSNFKLPKVRSIQEKVKILKNGGNVDLLFSSERCSVSETALQLLELVHQTLKDVCLSSPTVALEFCHAARDALLLYEAVIPVKLERQLDGINQVAVLIHNDCLFLSQEILGLKFEYQSDFPTSVKGAVFIDLGIRYKLMAEEILQRQIQLVKHNLMEAIDGADGFQNTHQPKRYESAKFSIDQVAFILEKVRIIWEPLLLPLTYKRSMCTVVEAVCSRMTKDILQLDDIAAEETLQIQRLIHMLLENLSSLLESLVGINQTTKPQEALSSSIDDLIPSLPQLRVLADMLDMPLKSITASWESGELAKCGYTSSEVKDFIRAIFTDSPLRKECLWRIENIKF
ncbi:putative RZZ complex, subunit Zw10 protein [Helianthus annuus]|nr:putative RZZ complex, subunit Zw10 protein [Helianthus annuus]